MLSGSYNHHEKKVKSREPSRFETSFGYSGFSGYDCNSVGVLFPQEMITSQTGASIVGKAGKKHRKGILF